MESKLSFCAWYLSFSRLRSDLVRISPSQHKYRLMMAMQTPRKQTPRKQESRIWPFVRINSVTVVKFDQSTAPQLQQLLK